MTFVRRFLLLSVVSIALALVLNACAGNPQVQLVKGGQTVSGLLLSAQAAENAFCMVDPTNATHCLGSVPGMTSAQLDAAHVKLAGLFKTAFKDLDIFATAAAAWKPGDGPINSLDVLKTDVDATIVALKTLPVSPKVQSVLDATQAVADAVLNLLKLKSLS
jgi:hypothetical protein